MTAPPLPLHHYDFTVNDVDSFLKTGKLEFPDKEIMLIVDAGGSVQISPGILSQTTYSIVVSLGATASGKGDTVREALLDAVSKIHTTSRKMKELTI